MAADGPIGGGFDPARRRVAGPGLVCRLWFALAISGGTACAADLMDVPGNPLLSAPVISAPTLSSPRSGLPGTDPTRDLAGLQAGGLSADRTGKGTDGAERQAGGKAGGRDEAERKAARDEGAATRESGGESFSDTDPDYSPLLLAGEIVLVLAAFGGAGFFLEKRRRRELLRQRLRERRRPPAPGDSMSVQGFSTYTRRTRSSR